MKPKFFGNLYFKLIDMHEEKYYTGNYPKRKNLGMTNMDTSAVSEIMIDEINNLKQDSWIVKNNIIKLLKLSNFDLNHVFDNLSIIVNIMDQYGAILSGSIIIYHNFKEEIQMIIIKNNKPELLKYAKLN